MQQLKQHRKAIFASLLSFVLVFASVGAACDKASLVRTVSDATTSLTAALEIADSAHRNGKLSDDADRKILTFGDQARLILIESNEFAKQFPDGTKPSQEKKDAVLSQLGTALKSFDKLLANGVFIGDKSAADKFLGYIRAARAGVASVIGIISKIETVQTATPGAVTTQPTPTARPQE